MFCFVGPDHKSVTGVVSLARVVRRTSRKFIQDSVIMWRCRKQPRHWTIAWVRTKVMRSQSIFRYKFNGGSLQSQCKMFWQTWWAWSSNLHQFVASYLYISLTPSKQQQRHLDKEKEANGLQGRHSKNQTNDSAAMVQCFQNTPCLVLPCSAFLFCNIFKTLACLPQVC